MIPTPAIQSAARCLLADLDAGHLHVAKVRAGRDSGYVRVVIQYNSDWYRCFCRKHETRRRSRASRKPRTIVKRCHTRKALLHLAAGKNSTLYSSRLIEFIERWVAESEEERARELEESIW